MSVYGPICWERHVTHLAAFSDTSHQMTQFQRKLCITYLLLITLLIADSGFGKWLWLAGWPISPPRLTAWPAGFQVWETHSLQFCCCISWFRFNNDWLGCKAQVSQYPKNLCVCKTLSLKCSQWRRQCFTPAFDKSHCLTEKAFAVQPSAKKIRLIVSASVQQSKQTCRARRQQSWPTWADAGHARVPETARSYILSGISFCICVFRCVLWGQKKQLRRRSVCDGK